MKTQLLDIDALLSQVAARLSMDPPEVAKALARLAIARDKLLALAETEEQGEARPRAVN